MNENTNTNTQTVDDFNGATVTLPLEKFCQIVSERAEAITMNNEWTIKYWQLHAEKEALEKQLKEMGRKP